MALRWRIALSVGISRTPGSVVASLTSFPTCTGKGLASARETAIKKVAPVNPRQEITSVKKLTEGEEGEEGDDESGALHVGRVEIERRERKGELRQTEERQKRWRIPSCKRGRS